MILAPSEVEAITGFKQKAAQIRWLQRNGWKFTVSGLGTPNVAIAEFNRHQVGGRAQKQEPNFAALNG